MHLFCLSIIKVLIFLVNLGLKWTSGMFFLVFLKLSLFVWLLRLLQSSDCGADVSWGISDQLDEHQKLPWAEKWENSSGGADYLWPQGENITSSQQETSVKYEGFPCLAALSGLIGWIRTAGLTAWLKHSGPKASRHSSHRVPLCIWEPMCARLLLLVSLRVWPPKTVKT